MIEQIRQPQHPPCVAAIDFDGTMSLIRMGWQSVMHRIMKDALLPWHPRPEQLDSEISGYIARSTGQPSVIQMAWVDEHVLLYGGPHHGAQYYLDQFSAALSSQIDTRIASMTDDASADRHMVPGARAFLQMLKARGVALALVSGTERHHLIRESQALRIHDLFDAGIYGPGAHHPTFTKLEALQHLVNYFTIPPGGLVSVGDGPVEIQAGRAVHGYCIGVASHEESGGLDEAKRSHLLHAGADAITPHFRHIDALERLLFAPQSQS